MEKEKLRNSDNRKTKPAGRKRYSIKDEVLVIQEKLKDPDLLNLHKEWMSNRTTPYVVDRQKLQIIRTNINESILEIYFSRKWESKALPENYNYCSYAAFSYETYCELDKLWWCYRELIIVDKRIYNREEPYF